MAIDDRFLEELRSKNDITDLISAYVNLGRRQGRTCKGLCPFHNERTPSFTVYEDTQSFYCFGCGAGGDAVSFVMKIENLDYIEAVKKLAQRAGLSMPEDGYDDSVLKKKKRMYEANKEAARFFHECLLREENRFALDYLLRRGFSMQTIKHFGLGYAPDSWDSLKKHMNSKGYYNSELFEADLLKKSNKNGTDRFYDNFRHRMMTPIIDVRGNIIGFGGRVLDDSKPKYINTADTLVYKKSNQVFALNFAKNGNYDSFIVAEGYMDVIALHQAGFTNSVACLGTALTKEQASLIKRYVGEVVLSYDSDEAGQKATQRALSIFSDAGLRVRVLSLRGGKDPDEIIKKQGREGFKMLLDGASNDIEYNLLKIRNKYDTQTTDGKTKFLLDAAKYLSTLRSPIERDTYASKLSEETGVSKESIISQIKTFYVQRSRTQKRETLEKEKRKSFGMNDKINPESRDNFRGAKAEEVLLATLFRNTDFWGKIKDEVSAEDFVTSFNRRVFVKLVERIEEGRDTELTVFAKDFSQDEMGRLSKLFNMMVSNTVQECRDCIKVLKEEKAGQANGNVAQMSDEEFAKLFKDMGKK